MFAWFGIGCLLVCWDLCGFGFGLFLELGSVDYELCVVY